MRLSPRPQRCPPGRSVKMHPRAEDTMGVGTEAAEGAMKEQEGAMKTELAEEEEVEGAECRAAGGREVEGEGAGIMMRGEE